MHEEDKNPWAAYPENCGVHIQRLPTRMFAPKWSDDLIIEYAIQCPAVDAEQCRVIIEHADSLGELPSKQGFQSRRVVVPWSYPYYSLLPPLPGTRLT